MFLSFATKLTYYFFAGWLLKTINYLIYNNGEAVIGASAILWRRLDYEALLSFIIIPGRILVNNGYVPDAAKKVLKRWDEVSAHYEIIEYRKYK